MPRYNPSDFTEYLDYVGAVPLEDAPESHQNGRHAPQGVAVVSTPTQGWPDPPFDRLNALRDNDARFKRTWDRNRSDMDDQSASSYDLAIANALAALGTWTDEEIISVIVAWRRRHGEDVSKVGRAGYQRSTLKIAKANYPAGVVSGPGADALIAAMAEASTDAEVEAARTAALTAAGDLVGVRITAAYRVAGTPPHYEVVIGGQTFDLGDAGKLLTPDALRKAMIDAHMPPIRRMKAERWDRFLELVSPACSEKESGASLEEVAEAMMGRYLRGVAIRESAREAFTDRAPYYDDEKRVCLWLDSLYLWAGGQLERPSRSQVSSYLRIFGAVPVRDEVYVTSDVRRSIRIWRLPAIASQMAADALIT